MQDGAAERDMSLGDRATGVVLAAGRGQRFASEIPKQFHKLAGRMLVEYPVGAFLAHPAIDEVIVAHPPGLGAGLESLRDGVPAGKALRLVSGGDTRPGSTRAVLRAIGNKAPRRKILFHDGARPFLSRAIIDRCLSALDRFDAVATVVPATDTILVLDPSGARLAAIPPRALLRRAQTPQGFRLGRIALAYQSLGDDELGRFTDDCGVFLARFPEAAIAAVEGHETNIKITSPQDMFLAERLMCAGEVEAAGRAASPPPAR